MIIPLIKSKLSAIKNAPQNVKATVFFGIASFSISGLKYFTTPIFTRLLSTSEYGVINIYNSWLTIIQVIMSVTLIYPGILNVGLYEHKNDRWKFLSSMIGLITVVSVGIIAIYIVLREQINSWIGIPSSLVVLLLLIGMIQPATDLWTMKQRYEYNYRITLLVTVGSAVAAQLISIASVVYLKNSGQNLAEVRLWSAGIVNLLVALILYFYILRKGRCFCDTALWKSTLIFAIPLIPHYLSYVVLNGTDKIMIGKMVGNDKAGIYGLVAILSSIGILFWRALMIAFSPFINAKLGERAFKEIREAVKVLWIFVGGFCVLGSIIAPEIIRIFATKDYLEGMYIIPPVAAGIFTYSMYDAFAAVSFFHKKSFNIMLASFTAAVTNIVLNYIAIKRFGYVAAGYTTFISHVILIFMHYFNIAKVEKEKVYDDKVVVLTLSVVTLACLACNALYSTPIYIRYIPAAGIMLYMFMRRKVLYQTLANMKA